MEQENQAAAWEKEKEVIPIMILKHCKAKHKNVRREKGVASGELCAECRELCDYALFRLEKCPFKVNKTFCSFCKIHCYKPEMRERIKAVMKYSGPRMLWTHPVFAFSHVSQMIKYKKSLRKEVETNDRNHD